MGMSYTRRERETEGDKKRDRERKKRRESYSLVFSPEVNTLLRNLIPKHCACNCKCTE